MGKAASKAFRPVKNFNVDNRARKVMDAEKPHPAPRHPSTAAAFDNIAREHPEFLEEQKKKHVQLDDFLKQVKVDSVGDNHEIKAKSDRSLPEDRNKNTPAEYGFPEPERIPEGRASLRQVLGFISQHHLDPRQNSPEKIAMDYKLDPAQVKKIVQYFQTLQMHIPQEMLDKNPKLLGSLNNRPAERQSLKGMDDVVKLSQGVNAGTQPKN
ncbi:protein NDUFAF4 homolog [Littorina saxatilis]|uniref:Uncharacterized protein n=1 Tax=Littorina saxatilis TaxID=31220 RepID=A0AAN9BKV5_9CAEN